MTTGKYKYTQNVGVLDENQRQFYEENGYIMIKNLVNEDLSDEICQRFIDICNGNVETGFMTIMKDLSLLKKGVKGQYLINKIQDWLFDDILFKYCCDQSVVDLVKSIIGPNVTAAHSMFINKPPDSDPSGSLHPLHQDLHYFPFRPAEKIVASWTALENIDTQNGCLFVVPGSHKGSLYKHDYPEGFKNRLYHGVHGLDHLPKVNLFMERGDTVFFHPILLHGSGPNLSRGFRKAISTHFADSNCYFIDVKGTSQENIEKEILTVATKKGYNASFTEIWKAKSRLVSGVPGRFQNLNSHL